MIILKRHIVSVIVATTLVVLLVLAGLQIFMSFLRQLDNIGQGNYGLWQAAQYVFLALPIKIYELFPMAGLLGCLLGLGYLSTNHELVVMRASGMSLWQIVHAVFLAALILLVFITSLGEIVGPSAMRMGTYIKTSAKNKGQSLRTEKGLWLREAKTFINIKTVVPGVELLGINRYIFNSKHQLVKNSHAKKAVYKEGKWFLYDIVETDFSKNKTATKTIKQEVWPIKVDSSLLNTVNTSANEISIPALYQLIRYQKINGLHAGSYDLQFWQRILQPFAILVMLFLAVPFVFGSLRSASMGLRIVFGSIIGFSFYLLTHFIGPFSAVYQIPAWLGAMSPIIIFFGAGCFFIYRIH